ncbi:MAG: hypothetical protein CM1200mP7_1870 [Chloroflexota bacterium]|nr:MAG: hypothetical protein CM1200mP7_1870 [Chloroflexota bacterium]
MGSFAAKSGWRAFTNKLPNGDLISAGSIGWEKLDVSQKNTALENGWVVRDPLRIQINLFMLILLSCL